MLVQMKKKDKFYRRNLINGLITGIGLIIIGALFLIVFLYRTKNDFEFITTAKPTSAEIIDVKYRSSEKELTKTTYSRIDVEDALYIVIKYNVNNAQYIKNLRTIDASMYIGKNINIYYNEDNPEQFVYTNYFTTIGLISTATLITIGGIIAVITEIKKIIRYIETLNGIEISAKITKVIEMKKLWWTEYKIECEGKDEAGNVHLFYSRNFREVYIENEIKKMKLGTLKVRYKKYQPNKYIVLTESLEKRLSR